MGFLEGRIPRRNFNRGALKAAEYAVAIATGTAIGVALTQGGKPETDPLLLALPEVTSHMNVFPIAQKNGQHGDFIGFDFRIVYSQKDFQSVLDKAINGQENKIDRLEFNPDTQIVAIATLGRLDVPDNFLPSPSIKINGATEEDGFMVITATKSDAREGYNYGRQPSINNFSPYDIAIFDKVRMGNKELQWRTSEVDLIPSRSPRR